VKTDSARPRDAITHNVSSFPSLGKGRRVCNTTYDNFEKFSLSLISFLVGLVCCRRGQIRPETASVTYAVGSVGPQSSEDRWAAAAPPREAYMRDSELGLPPPPHEVRSPFPVDTGRVFTPSSGGGGVRPVDRPPRPHREDND